MKHLLIFLLLCTAISKELYAQCDVGIQVQPNSFDIIVKTPQPGSTYSWATDDGQNGNGTTFSISRNSSMLTIFRDGAPASNIQLGGQAGCLEEIGGFTYVQPDPCQSCTYKFIPSNTSALSHLWDFGDNTPTSTNVMPTHTYSAAGTYTVTHTVTFVSGGIITTSVCSQTITVVCGTESKITEWVECCQLHLKICGEEGGCSHLWEILNANNQVALSNTDSSPEFVLANINTYNNNSVTIRHTRVCLKNIC